MKHIGVLVVALVMAGSATAAWAQGAKTEAPFKRVEGVWEGTARTVDGLPYPVRAEIKADGTARQATPNWLPSATFTPGKVSVKKDPKSGADVMYFNASGQEAMAVAVDVVDGRRVLRLSRPDGSIIELFEQNGNNGKK
jgi:hypothetical protein